MFWTWDNREIFTWPSYTILYHVSISRFLRTLYSLCCTCTLGYLFFIFDNVISKLSNLDISLSTQSIYFLREYGLPVLGSWTQLEEGYRDESMGIWDGRREKREDKSNSHTKITYSEKQFHTLFFLFFELRF